MEDVTDPPFRAVCKQNGADIMFTEFISSEGLIRHAIKCQKKLDIFNYERPIGIQIFGGDEDSLALAAKIVDVAEPDFLDINFGCPVKKVACKGAGAGVLKDVDLMVRLTEAVVKASALPVTVKTRLGWDEATKNIETVAERLQDVGIKALSIHGRTRCQMYKGTADWTLIGQVKNNPRIHIPIYGNGDIDSPQKAIEYQNRYGVDGIMIGRAAIGYPWIFREIKHLYEHGQLLDKPSLEERIAVCKQHLEKSIAWKGEFIGIREMRRHYGNYLKGLPGIKEFRNILVIQEHAEAIIDTLNLVLKKYEGIAIEEYALELPNYHEKCTS
ncbi:unnamed protein product [Rotaria socialis]|uniref:tRNA-dihydrouridine synthase n=1 Tax=Rotaria socialis TaxID=392032 RepID=A0A817WMU2_9BILA|nr:unnamed protein product [Rotaria socialis]CAF4646288.1 unnamed protein product [Rotaria socialis]